MGGLWFTRHPLAVQDFQDLFLVFQNPLNSLFLMIFQFLFL
uniref:Uncharacterized protein n=1 Tax=virus sp. ctkyY8 TaxID=2827995 RepID=A0A8S5RDS4_9VIRU|nr:MAG TPA: hypothetical protein [virus sp. ctkyY8]